MLNNEYCKRVYEQILARDPDQKEFHQAVYEVLEGLEPMVERRPELENPKEQYDECVRLMADKIRSGQVPGITDPE